MGWVLIPGAYARCELREPNCCLNCPSKVPAVRASGKSGRAAKAARLQPADVATGPTDSWFDRKARIALTACDPIWSAHAQDNRADHSLFRNTRSADQHLESRRFFESGTDVVGMVARLE